MPKRAPARASHITCQVQAPSLRRKARAANHRTPCPVLGKRLVLGQRHRESGDADRTAGSLRKVALPFKSVLRTGALRIRAPEFPLWTWCGPHAANIFGTPPAVDGAVAKYPAYRPVLQPNTSARFHPDRYATDALPAQDRQGAQSRTVRERKLSRPRSGCQPDHGIHRSGSRGGRCAGARAALALTPSTPGMPS